VWLIRQYLSRAHRDAGDEGCLFPSALLDAAAEGGAYRDAVVRELHAFSKALGETIAPGDPTGEARALGVLATLIGGLGLARAVGDGPLSATILAESRKVCYAALGVEEEATRSRSRS
jgi:TetR/AcrR family transcriptional repressor of nem operon